MRTVRYTAGLMIAAGAALAFASPAAAAPADPWNNWGSYTYVPKSNNQSNWASLTNTVGNGTSQAGLSSTVSISGVSQSNNTNQNQTSNIW